MQTGEVRKNIKDLKYSMRSTVGGCGGHCSLYLTLGFTSAISMWTNSLFGWQGPATAQARIAHRPLVGDTAS